MTYLGQPGSAGQTLSVGSDGRSQWKTTGEWISLYEVDFSSLSTLDIKTSGDGSKTIDGKTWTAVNTGNASAFSITNGTGLIITSNNSGANWYLSNRAVPLLTIPFSSLGTFPSSPHDIRASIHYSFSPTAAYHYLWLASEKTSSPTGNRRHVAHGFGSYSILEQDVTNSGANGPNVGIVLPVGNNMLVAEFFESEASPIRAVRGYGGIYSGGWPASSSLTPVGNTSIFVTTGYTTQRTSGDTSLAIGCGNPSTGTPITATIYRCKVEYRISTGINLIGT